MDISLTDRELDIMRVLWEAGPSTVAEVREHLNDPLAYTTVLTMLRILEEKGYARREEAGRAHRYFANVKEQAARKSAVRRLTENLFKGSAELLLTQIVSDQKLTGAQADRIRQLLDEKFDKEK